MHPTLIRHHHERPATSELPRSPAWHSHLRARLRAAAIDYELAAGIPSWESPRHAARALQLTAPRRRRALARSLDRLIVLSATPADRLSALPLCRGQIKEAIEPLQATARRLRARPPVNARGMAMLMRLITDATGPCYVRRASGSLAGTLMGIAPWLEVED